MMQHVSARSLIAAAFLLAHVSVSDAQQRPNAGQARAMLQARPELVAQLRQQLLTSGMTRDQVRARLRAEGYPENLLDAYLPGAAGAAEAPSTEVFAAVQELGIADDEDVGFLRMLQSDSLSQSQVDSLVSVRNSGSGGRRVVRTDVADSIVRADSGYNIFGLEMFTSSRSRFDPGLFGPVDANYRLGPGDRLVLILTGDVEDSYTLDVTREGFVVIPQVGQLHVANLTLGQLEDVLFTRLQRVYSGVRRGPGATTRFSLSVARLRSNQVFVLGDVVRPGGYMVSSAGTAINALYAAGGPTANGTLRGVQIKRRDQLVGTFDLYDYLLRGDAMGDPRLETGDVVFVPPRGPRVRIVGEVVRPATYEMKADETLMDLVRAAGGFSADASQRRVQIERILPAAERTEEGRERVTVDVVGNGDGVASLSPIRLLPGDVVKVFSVAARVRNTVTVRGNVWNPGPLGMVPGMRISDAIRRAGGPKPDVYLGQILVSRLRADSTRLQLRAAFADATGAVLGDIPLLEDDLVEVFSLTRFRPDRYVSIGGAVRRSGRFPFREGMTVRDLVLLAGGLVESAYLREAEIARLPADRQGVTTAITIRAPLDSTYLFERQPGAFYPGAPGLPAPASGAPEVGLQAYDNVLIMHQPNWELQRVVTISGEVRFPGPYALRTRTERLADLIDRAGGFSPDAYPEAAVFERFNNQVGRVAIDVPKAMRNRRSSDNLQLLDGDRITIPQRSNVVSVRGAVNAPNVLAYVEGRDVFYYIDQAGGGSRLADMNRVFVTQPNGRREVRRLGHTPKPLPGAVVEVPAKDPAERLTLIQTLATLTPVLASIVTLFIALR